MALQVNCSLFQTAEGQARKLLKRTGIPVQDGGIVKQLRFLAQVRSAALFLSCLPVEVAMKEWEASWLSSHTLDSLLRNEPAFKGLEYEPLEAWRRVSPHLEPSLTMEITMPNSAEWTGEHPTARWYCVVLRHVCRRTDK